MSDLTAKQQSFVEEYLIDLNATQAAIRAGYSDKTARKIGQENLTKPDIEKAIQELLKQRSERTKIDADYVLKRLVEIDELDVLDIFSEDLGRIKDLSDWPKAWRISISGIDVSELFEYNEGKKDLSGLVKKIKWPDKTKNLELLGKHIGVQAFKEVKELSGTLTNNIMLVPSCTSTDEWEKQAETQQSEVLKKQSCNLASM